MSRVIVSPDQIPLAEDFLDGQKLPMLDIGALVASITGGQPVADGMDCAPTLPVSLAVSLSPGYVLWPTVVDATPYGVLPADMRPTMKVGFYDGATLPIAAPVSPGQQVVFLLEVTFTEQDAVPQVEEYYNAANPNMPFSGPGNNGSQQYTRRVSRASVQLKAGAPAAVGQAVAPGADPGWQPLWLITVGYGSTGINAGDITQAPGAARFRMRLTSNPADLSGYATHAEVSAEAQSRTNADAAMGVRIDGLQLGFRAQTAIIAPTTFVVPAGISCIKATVVAGGGGGGASNSTAAGAGGGAGGTVTTYVNVTPGQSIAVQVGPPASGGQNGGDGSNGLSASFGPYASASGGQGGRGGNSSGAGGSGGEGFGNGLNVKGGFGSDAAGDLTRGGEGGASSFGGGGRASNGLFDVVENGPAWGSGGGGGYGRTNNQGGLGQQGVVIIEY